MGSVVVVEAGGRSATHSLSDALALRLRRRAVAVVACTCSAAGPRGLAQVTAAVRRALEGGGSGRPAVVLFGDECRQRRLVWGLTLSGLLPMVRLIVHATAAEIPYEPSLADLFACADVVVTESELGARAVRRCCAEAAEPPPEIVVTPPASPLPSRLPELTPAGRRALRRDLMGVDDDAVLVGCRTGEGPDELAPLVLRIFHMFARGYYWRCDHCGHVTPWDEDDQLGPLPRDRCARCGSVTGAAGVARDDAQLYMIGEPADEDDGLWRTQTISAARGLDNQVVHDRALPTIRSAKEWWLRWNCVDVHLQPHLLADLPESMRASCALGVPIVATRYGAVEERLAGAARLVPPRLVLDHSAGHRIALIDPGGALTALCRLADDRQSRQHVADHVGQLAQRHEAADLLAGLVDQRR